MTKKKQLGPTDAITLLKGISRPTISYDFNCTYFNSSHTFRIVANLKSITNVGISKLRTNIDRKSPPWHFDSSPRIFFVFLELSH